MNLEKYDNKLVRIKDCTDDVFEGICTYNSSDYNECEYGRNGDSLQILYFAFYEDTIKEIEVIDDFSSNYGKLEELILEDGNSMIIDAFEYEDDIHNNRILLCIEDKLNNNLLEYDSIKEVLDYAIKYFDNDDNLNIAKRIINKYKND